MTACIVRLKEAENKLIPEQLFKLKNPGTIITRRMKRITLEAHYLYNFTQSFRALLC